MKNFKFLAIALMLVGTLSALGNRSVKKRLIVYEGWAHIYNDVTCDFGSLDPVYLGSGGCDRNGFGNVCTIQSKPAYPTLITCEANPIVYLRRPF